VVPDHNEVCALSLEQHRLAVARCGGALRHRTGIVDKLEKRTLFDASGGDDLGAPERDNLAPQIEPPVDFDPLLCAVGRGSFRQAGHG
jgi:hypothetical protein